MSHLFAYLSRMKYIKRWGLMRSNESENIQEHSARVAMIAHALAAIRRHVYGGSISPDRTALLALYHDASEVITGDLPTPIKYFNPSIKDAYREIESVANSRFTEMVPEELRPEYQSVFNEEEKDSEHWQLVKAADKLCALLKCREELQSGNTEFAKAEKALTRALEEMALPEVEYFISNFVKSFSLTLDELG